METYKNIIDFENYEVSNFGNVRNKKTNKILKPRIGKDGYHKIDIRKNYKRYTKKLHRLIAEAFIENLENKSQVDHIDNNKSNNNINNLRWATSQENNRNRQLNANNTSGWKGIDFHKKSNKWRAQICIDGISIHLGLFDNIEDAKQARVIKANAAFGIYINSCENH